MEMNTLWKYSALIVTFTLISLSASAVGSGPYLGGGLQYSIGDVDYTNNATFTAGIEKTTIQTADISANGFSGLILLGYGFSLPDQFYLGIETQGAISANQEGSISTSAFFPDGTEVIELNAKTKFLNNYGAFLLF